MGDKKLRPLLIVLLLVLVVVSSIFLAIRKNDKKSDIDIVISKYENKLLTKETYLDDSLYLDIEKVESNEVVVFTISAVEYEVEDVIIIISNKEDCMSYGIKDSINTDFVLNDYNKSEGRVRGAQLMFDKSDDYYIYLSFYHNNQLVEEYIHQR